MSLYVFKILDKLLELPKEKKAPSKQLFPNSKGKKDFQTYQKKENNNYSQENNRSFTKNNKKQEIFDDSAYCLFANSGESFLAVYKKEKINIFLKDISHPDKKTFKSKQANNFINEQIKGKNVYLDDIQENNDGIIANVYLDKEKMVCLNTLLKEEDLHISEKYENMHSQNTLIKEKEDNISQPSKKQTTDSSSNLIGYIIAFGEANYKNEPNANKSYFIEIELNGKKSVRWGLDFKRAIRESQVNIGDYVEVKKLPANSKIGAKNLWSIEKKADIYNHQDIEANLIPLNEPEFEPDLNEPFYESPPNWDEPPDYDWDDSNINLNEINSSSITIKP